jgi:hypothetical protein
VNCRLSKAMHTTFRELAVLTLSFVMIKLTDLIFVIFGVIMAMTMKIVFIRYIRTCIMYSFSGAFREEVATTSFAISVRASPLRSSCRESVRFVRL